MGLSIPPDWQIKVLISTQHKGAANLHWEESLYKEVPEKTVYFLLYVNEPTIVIGRFQNPWKEVNIRKANEQKLPILRRISGGGTVFHDMGNLNFALISAKGFDSYGIFDFVKNTLIKIGLPVEKNKRGDLLLRKKKISGCAHAYRRGNSLHHGTLLVKSDLNRLKGVLKGGVGTMRTHAVESFPSPVINCADVDSSISLDALAEELIKNFRQKNPHSLYGEIHPQEEADQRSWERVFGGTPVFEYEAQRPLGRVTARIKDGFTSYFSLEVKGEKIKAEDPIPWKRNSLEALELPQEFKDFMADWLRWERI